MNDARLPPEVVEQVGWLRQQTELPICIGFGISRPEQVRMLAPVADGVIVGSALVRHLADVDSQGSTQVLQNIGQLVDQLQEALRSATSLGTGRRVTAGGRSSEPGFPPEHVTLRAIPQGQSDGWLRGRLGPGDQRKPGFCLYPPCLSRLILTRSREEDVKLDLPR